MEIDIHYIIPKDNYYYRAIVEGTNAKAYLVANLALIDGVDASIEQYSISREHVLAALLYYLQNRTRIEQELADNRAKYPTESAEEQFARIKAKAEAWRKQQES